MESITLPAAVEKLDEVQAFVEGCLEAHGCPMKTLLQIQVAVEEIFVNIAHYAYGPEGGEATVGCAVAGTPPVATIRFADGGRPYNPLDNADPDTSLSAEERDIGGLGIFIVKKNMDEVAYAYIDGQNVLTLVKAL